MFRATKEEDGSMKNNQGGYPIPPDIALILMRFFFLSKFSDLFNLNRVYWMDNNGWYVKEK